MPKTHEIKIHPKHFRSVQANEMTFQVRLNDRDYQPGDTLAMYEFEPTTNHYTGLSLVRAINRVYSDVPGLQPGYIAMTLRSPLQER